MSNRLAARSMPIVSPSVLGLDPFDRPDPRQGATRVMVWGGLAVLLGVASAVLLGWGTGLWEISVLYGGLLIAFAGLRITWALGRIPSGSGLGPSRSLVLAAINAQEGAVAVSDADGRLMCANMSYGRLFGGYPGPFELAADDMAGRQQLQDLARAAQVDGLAQTTLTLRRAQGDVELSCRAARDPMRMLVWSAVPGPITRARQELVDALNGRVGGWLDRLGEALVATDGSGRVLALTSAAGARLGQPPAEVVDRPLAQFLKLEGQDVVAVGGSQGRVPLQVRELQVPSPSGGEPVGYLFLLEDRNARAGAQDGFMVPAFIDTLPLALAMADRDGRILYANASFRQATGCTLDERVIYPSDLVADEDRGLLSDVVRRVGSGGLAQELPLRLRHQPELMMPIMVSPVTGFGPAAILLVLRDNSEQQKLQLQVSQAQRMQAVGQLAGGIAHDFNNILTAIIGFCDLLLTRHPPGDSSFADIHQILTNANRAASLVKQLLAFSRRQTLRLSVVQLSDLLSEQITTLKRLIGEQVRLDVQHGRDIGLVRLDPGQFYQVIMNLVVNARDAMPDGGRVTIKTSRLTATETPRHGDQLMPAGDYVVLEVSDTGMGIPAEHLQKIFEPFFTTKEVGKGTGLGLSTVYGIIKQSGGFVFADSTVGRGTTFTIYLPVHSEAEPVAEARPQLPGDDLWGTGTVLLVEDEDAVRAFARKALERKGYKVLAAANGEQALDILAETDGPIDVMVTDVVMPNMDGPTLVEKVRGSRPAMKIIFISGYAEETLRRSVDSPDVAFLPKPFSLKELAGAVKTALSGRTGTESGETPGNVERTLSE